MSRDERERREDGTFKKGVSGNPNGRPRLPEVFRAKGPAMLDAIVEIAEDKAHPDRFDALRWCCERIFGKATQAVDVTGEMTPAAAALLALAAKAVKAEGEGEG